MSTVGHLNEKAAKTLEMSDKERIQYLKSPRWIGYPRAKEVLAKLEDLMDYPKTHRMPNILLVGHTNNGKSTIVNRFEHLHPAKDALDRDCIHVPVLVIESPPTPSESRLYDKILDKLFAPYRLKDAPEKKLSQIVDLLKKVNLQILFIDEIHNILAGSAIKQREVLNVIKHLGNELKIPIVGVGTKEALRAINSNEQLANRFEPVSLPRWKNDEEFLRLLASFERMLPLKKPSNLPQAAIAKKLHAMSEGCIGELSTILIRAGSHCIRNHSEKIDVKCLDAINWVLPSDRRRDAELMC